MVDKKSKERLNSGVKFTILAVVLIAIFCISITPVTLQNDTYYTIKVGEHIAKNGIDMKDPFSWHEDLAYTYPHWGYDLITYFIYNAFGFSGIYITTCMLSAILGISIYFVNKKLAKNQIFSFIISIGAMHLLRDYIAARAQLVTFILFIWTIFFIEKFIETKKKRYVGGLLLIPIAIANLHVAVFPFYFILYLPYIAEYILAILAEIIIYRKTKIYILKKKILKASRKENNEEKLELLEKELKQLEEKNDRIKIKRTKELQNPYKIKFTKNENVKWLIIIMIICVFTGLLTPLGDTPYTYLVKTMQGNTTQNISEHLPMTLINDSGILSAIVIFLSILIFTKSKIKLSDLFMLGGLSFLMLKTKRQATMFVIICGITLNRLMKQLMQEYTKLNENQIINKICNSFRAFILVIVVLFFSYNLGKSNFNAPYIDVRTYPVKASEFILENIDLKTARFYNEYNYGSYLLFKGIPVFVDSRADLYAPEFSKKEEDIFMDFIETSSIAKFYGDTFEKYNITHVITYQNSKVNMIITKTEKEKYKELYKDNYFVIYEIVRRRD